MTARTVRWSTASPGASRTAPPDDREHDATVGNLLLRGLPAASLDAMRSYLDVVTLGAGRVVVSPDEAIESVYFPLTGLFAETVRLSDGSAVEVNLVGREGLSGIAVALGAGSVPIETITVVPGAFLRAPAGALREQVRVDRALADRLQRYAQTLLNVRAYSAACDRLHPIQARLARWLLKAHDRLGADEFPLTQDDLALMLGVARPSVTVNAIALQQAGLIEYRRGRIRILDRDGLEATTCECYRAIAREFERLLGWSIG